MDLILQNVILNAIGKKKPHLSSAIERLTDLKDNSIGTCVFTSLPVEDYESLIVDIRFVLAIYCAFTSLNCVLKLNKTY